MHLKFRIISEAWKNGPIALIKYCFEEIMFKNLAITYNILVFNKGVTLQCTHRTSKYQESEKSQILLCDSLGPFSHAPS